MGIELKLVPGKGFVAETGSLDQLPEEMIVKDIATSQLKNVLEDYVVCIRSRTLRRHALASSFRMILAESSEDFSAIPFEEVLLPETSVGTGVVIGKEMVKGNEEYLILTNNHVVNPRPFTRSINIGSGDASIVDRIHYKTDLAVVEDMYTTSNKTSLEVVATAQDNDAALVRTVGAKSPMQVFPFNLGAQSVGTGDAIITAGFPGGEGKITGSGEIISTNSIDFALTGYPNQYYRAHMPIDPGQSGSPVVSPRVHYEAGRMIVDFPLIGLVYGKGQDSDTVRMITPWEGFKEMVHTRKTLQSKRPRLDARMEQGDLESLLFNSKQNLEDSAFLLGDLKQVFAKHGAGYTLREYPCVNASVVLDKNIKWKFRSVNGGVVADKVQYVVKGKIKKTISLADHPNFAKLSSTLILGKLNQLKLIERSSKFYGSPKSSEEGKQFRYLQGILGQNMGAISAESYLLHTELYRRNFFSASPFMFWNR